MATIAVTSCVYLGDVAPYIPVARRLHDAGHDVVFVAPEGFRRYVEPESFRFHPSALDCSPSAMHADPVHRRLMEHPVRNASKLGSYWMDRAFTSDSTAVMASLQAGFAGADVVVTHPTMAVAAIPAARSVGAKVVVGHLFPMMISTRRWSPPLGRRSRRFPGPVNAAMWSLLRAGSGRPFHDREINAARAGVGLAPMRGNAGWAWTEADETVLLTSRHYIGDGADDWPAVTWGGFSAWEGPAGQTLDPVLDAYVAAGDPPVLVTLGTSAATGAGGRFARIAADLDDAGLRSVLLVGDPANLAVLGGRPGAVTFAPLTALLPRCQVAVVSGALGGVAAALSAGVPVVIHPQLFDQYWHGGRVEELGVGILATRVGKVGAAVRRIVGDPSYRTRAAALAARMTAEDGPGAVVAAVERLLAAGVGPATSG